MKNKISCFLTVGMPSSSSRMCSIIEIVCALMNIPHHYWVEVVNTNMYIINNIPTIVVYDVTPKEKFTSRKPYLFGCIMYVHVVMLDPKVDKYILWGTPMRTRGIGAIILLQMS